MPLPRSKTKRIASLLVLELPVMLLGILLYLWLRPPAREAASDIHVSMNPYRIERGKYLFTGLSGCDACHSERDFSQPGGLVVVSGRGKGQVMPFRDLPGRIVASNITPDRETGIGSWTDGEKIRAIRDGVSKDGHALYPLMPYLSYRNMTDEDVESLVAYMDTLPAVRNSLPRTQVNFLPAIIMKGLPQPVVDPIPPASSGGGEIYGEYVSAIGACVTCHTPERRLEPDPDMLFAGGRVFATPLGVTVSPNITPDVETGIGSWDYRRFEARMHSSRPDRFAWMPWEGYGQLLDQDLQTLFLSLKAQRPIRHRVDAGRIGP